MQVSVCPFKIVQLNSAVDQGVDYKKRQHHRKDYKWLLSHLTYIIYHVEFTIAIIQKLQQLFDFVCIMHTS